ncbi:MAG: hypothetical protein IJQ82_07315 [Selenomonadaceae bacterium]|nr:hypothetical protein [Selenomonadaceae bacterium]
MKKIFLAAVVFLLLTAQVEAVPFTRTQLDKMFFDVGQVQTDSTLALNAETFKEKFNGIITPLLKEAMGTDDVSAMEPLFLIKNYKIIGETFTNIFNDYRIGIVGNCAADGNFKVLTFYYTTPEEKDESIFTIWLMTAFVKSIAPEVNPQILMNELTAENSSGNVVKGDVKFSLTEDGNLNALTATKAK